jgi:hypothetical protein
MFYYKMKGNPYAYGPFKAKDEKSARQAIREMWGLKTLHGVEVWRA